MPNLLILFLKNSTSTNVKLIPWSQFKQIINQIYDHRIENSQEIYGMVNQTHMTHCEHLILYMLEKHQSRQQAELSLVEFLASLNYYAQRWYRARTYAQLCQFIDQEVDLHLSEFYFQAYNLSRQESVLES